MLHRISAPAAASSRDLDNVFDSTALEGQAKFTEQKQQAGNSVVNALSDHVFRVLRTVIGIPKNMLVNLDDGYESKSIASRISQMPKLISVQHTSLREDVNKHTDLLSGSFEHFCSIGASPRDSVAIRNLNSFSKIPELAPVTASIKKLSELELKCRDVSTRLAEEVANLLYAPIGSFRATTASVACQICLRLSHATKKCFLNQLNRYNQLQPPNETVKQILTPEKRRTDRKNCNTSSKNKLLQSEIYAMAKIRRRNFNQAFDRMMLDSGITSHTTPVSENVRAPSSCDVTDSLRDDSSVHAEVKCIRTVNWLGTKYSTKGHPSENLFVPVWLELYFLFRL